MTSAFIGSMTTFCGEPVESMKLTRAFYNRNTLLVARALLGKYLVHQTPEGLVRGRIVETEAYAGIFDPASHTYKNQRTDRNTIWYGEGGFAYVYQIYGSYFCLGIITEPVGVPGAVLVRALEPTDGIDLLVGNLTQGRREAIAPGKQEQWCNGPSKLCIAMGINKDRCNHLDLCGDILYLEDADTGPLPVEDIVFAQRINIDYAGAGALAAWRYYLRQSPAISKRSYEPLRGWRAEGYPSLKRKVPLDLFSHLSQSEAMPMMSQDVIAQIKALPKVELHLHLEGCMTLQTLQTLFARNRKPLPIHLAESTSHYFANYDEFVHAYHTICQALVNTQDFVPLIADLADYLRRENIIYCEVAWTPFLYLNRGLRFAEVMQTMNEALDTYGIRDRVNFVIDIQRDHGLEAGAWVYEQVFAASRDQHIVGVGLTGQEEGFPPAEFQTLYRRAQEHGLGCTAHAGEYGSAEDIWQCVRDLQVSRVGHGIRATQDRALLSLLAERGIHLEMCPTSNVRLQRVMTYSSHPLRSLWEQQINIGINTDDPGILGTDLTSEYLKVMEHNGLSLHSVGRTVLDSLTASFALPAQKAVLEQQLHQHWGGVL
jgi:adenosine deaminase